MLFYLVPGLLLYLPLSVWKMNVLCCEHSSTFILDWIFFIPSGNKDKHECLDGFELEVESTSNWS